MYNISVKSKKKMLCIILYDCSKKAQMELNICMDHFCPVVGGLGFIKGLQWAN